MNEWYGLSGFPHTAFTVAADSNSYPQVRHFRVCMPSPIKPSPPVIEIGFSDGRNIFGCDNRSDAGTGL